MEEMESGRAEQTRWGCPVAYIPALFDTQGTRGAGLVLGSTHARSLAPDLPPYDEAQLLATVPRHEIAELLLARQARRRRRSSFDLVQLLLAEAAVLEGGPRQVLAQCSLQRDLKGRYDDGACGLWSLWLNRATGAASARTVRARRGAAGGGALLRCSHRRSRRRL